MVRVKLSGQALGHPASHRRAFPLQTKSVRFGTGKPSEIQVDSALSECLPLTELLVRSVSRIRSSATRERGVNCPQLLARRRGLVIEIR